MTYSSRNSVTQRTHYLHLRLSCVNPAASLIPLSTPVHDVLYPSSSCSAFCKTSYLLFLSALSLSRFAVHQSLTSLMQIGSAVTITAASIALHVSSKQMMAYSVMPEDVWDIVCILSKGPWVKHRSPVERQTAVPLHQTWSYQHERVDTLAEIQPFSLEHHQ